MVRVNQHLGPMKKSESNCIPSTPVPPEVLAQYRVNDEPDAQKDIADYIRGQARDEEIRSVERVKTEYVLGDKHEVWDVITNKNRWWVITNPTNLYSQEHFASLDY